MKNFGIIMYMLLTIIVGMFIGGFIISKLWGWFIVPTFGLNYLTILQAIGISLFVSLFKTQKKSKKEFDIMNYTEQFFQVLVYSGLILFISWIVSMFFLK